MSETIFENKPDYIREIFHTNTAVIGMIHLKPLPGSPRFSGGNLDPIYDFAMKDLEALERAGVDGVIIENAWDIPFRKPDNIGYETVASMTAIAQRIKVQTDLAIGMNVLANGALQALSIAQAVDLPFIRVNQWVNAYIANEGFVEGASAEAMRYRSQIKGENIKIFTDVHVKHGSHSIVADRSIQDQTHDNIFFDADVLIATGTRTGNAADLNELTGIKNNSTLPVIVGSGMSEENAEEILRIADGCIIGSSIKENGEWWKNVSEERTKKFMNMVHKVRNGKDN
ncbi:BtpA/SgcQ family protein [Oceanobacillus sp. FSL K6-3682]|uniref:BtpA/SgcQ family protein n=1 Tax=Oceanobacillus sp. FSL K6-3682 TaxID=2921503 RepID=UPI0030D97C1A